MDYEQLFNKESRTFVVIHVSLNYFTHYIMTRFYLITYNLWYR